MLLSIPLIAPEGPAEAVLAVLHDLQPALVADDILLTFGFHSSTYDLFTVGWRLTTGAPEVADHQVVMVEGEQIGDRWRPTGEVGPELLTLGVACETPRGWVVAATSTNGEGELELVGHIRAFLDALDDLTAQPLPTSP